MRVQLHARGLLQQHDELYFVPQTEEDHKLLERVLSKFVIIGFGRHAGTNKLLHLRLELKRRDEETS
jgi:hypothetical protein